MFTSTLDKLESQLRTCVRSNDAVGIRESIISLCAELEVPSVGDPSLVVRSPDTQAVIDRCAQLIFSAHQPQPLALCAELLLCSASRLVVVDKPERSFQLIRRALTLAEASGVERTLRRALNNSAVSFLHAGDMTLSLVYGARAYALSKMLGDSVGELSALCNVTGTLAIMGLHSDCLALTKFTQAYVVDDTLATMRFAKAGTLCNAAVSHLALRQFAAAARAASHSLRLLRTPSTFGEVWCATNADSIWLRSAIKLGDSQTALARITAIEARARDFRVGRIEIICEHAVAAHDLHLRKHRDAIDRLLGLRERTKSLPGLHCDSLTLLEDAYQAIGDHASAFACLAEQVEHRSVDQAARVASFFAEIGIEACTISPVHDLASGAINRVMAQPLSSLPSRPSRANVRAMQETFERLAVAAELNEDDSGRHSYRVGRLAGLLAAQVGHDAEIRDNIELAARLHDIGKLGLPSALLARPQALSAAETTVMREHTEIGRKILEQANDPAFDLAKDIAYSHRERWDGEGYPQKLRQTAIPEAARMTAIAEAFDVLTHGRAYQAAVSVPDALSRIQQASGAQFEPRLVSAFVDVVNRLYREHECDAVLLSDYLGSAGTASSFLQARESMHSLMGSL